MKKSTEVQLIPSLGLGKLPTKDWSDRERYIIALWEKMKKDGAKVLTVKRKTQTGFKNYAPILSDRKAYENTIPEAMKEQEADYFLDIMPGYVKEVKPDLQSNSKGKIKIETEKTDFTIGLLNIVNLAYQIQGAEALIIPVNTGLSQREKDILDAMSVFVDKTGYRDNMSGVYFNGDKDEVVATDGFRLLVLSHSGKTNGIFDKKGNIIKETFPDYQKVLSAQNTPGDYLIVSISAILKYIKNTKPFFKQRGEGLLFYSGNRIVSLDALLFEDILKFAQKGGVEEIELNLSKPDAHNEVDFQRTAVGFSFKSNMGDVTGLIMPRGLVEIDEAASKNSKTIKYRDISTNEIKRLIKEKVSVRGNDNAFESLGGFDLKNYQNPAKAKKYLANKSRQTRSFKAVTDHGAGAIAAQKQRIRILGLKYKYQK